jgi:predicted RNase H-like nuclease (RuvC/YqgF family)
MMFDDQTVVSRLFTLTENLGKTQAALDLTSQSLAKATDKLDDVIANQNKFFMQQSTQEEDIKRVENSVQEYKETIKELSSKNEALEDRIEEQEKKIISLEKVQMESFQERTENVKKKLNL